MKPTTYFPLQSRSLHGSMLVCCGLFSVSQYRSSTVFCPTVHTMRTVRMPWPQGRLHSDRITLQTYGSTRSSISDCSFCGDNTLNSCGDVGSSAPPASGHASCPRPKRFLSAIFAGFGFTSTVLPVLILLLVVLLSMSSSSSSRNLVWLLMLLLLARAVFLVVATLRPIVLVADGFVLLCFTKVNVAKCSGGLFLLVLCC